MPSEEACMINVVIDRRVVMNRVADSMSIFDFSLRWTYAYYEKIDAIICMDMITGAWYRVPMERK